MSKSGLNDSWFEMSWSGKPELRREVLPPTYQMEAISLVLKGWLLAGAGMSALIYALRWF